RGARLSLKGTVGPQRRSPAARRHLRGGERLAGGQPAFRPRQEHAHLAPILAITVAEEVDEVALLEGDADEDVTGGRDGEEQMADRHVGGRPEGDQEPKVDRMADELVEARRLEGRRAGLAAEKREHDLLEAEQLEMV